MDLKPYIEALEKNGARQVRGAYIQKQIEGGEEITYACAIGQMSLNLGLEPFSIHVELNRNSGDYRYCPVCEDRLGGTLGLGSLVVHFNDHHLWSYQQIADWMKTLEESNVRSATA